MTHAQHAETINGPIAAVYQQWLDVESFPKFVPALRAVTATSDFYSHWTLSIGRITREFAAEITEQLPEERVSWRSLTGDVTFDGSTTFEEITDETTKVTVTVNWTPQTPAEHAAATFKADDRAIRTALRGFKQYAEENGGPSGHSYVTLRSADPEPATPADTKTPDDNARTAFAAWKRRGRQRRK